ncbi:hypothetical protein [Winogradskyella bathintestinalis]|uniref:Uncharacterized protein n=1 Tax=Winogradskyella bathintestinalis TaxID=3035208 RepID=A0ABT7ZZ62_9FLAO|nr:hypothetical protein [Winogradskyella bathintestinalis]MDN3494287.1 hypothetical protein [Winogradskyella bathintestinalis]
MDKEILDIISIDFKTEQKNSVVKELSSINLNHVMAESEYNLKNTRMSILYLAKGELSEVEELTKRAKIDFRDVIMWATQEKNLKNI